MSEKPEALEVADGVEFCPQPYKHAAARLLRRLHAENERLMTRLVEAKDKALRYDLDAAGISNREKEALELVELRAENERLMEALEIIAGCRQCVDPLMGNQDVAIAALRREET